MITKISVLPPYQWSMVPEKDTVSDGKRIYGLRTFKDHKFIKDVADQMVKIAAFIAFVEQYPDHNARKALGAFFDEKPIVKIKTKTKRTYQMWLMHVHEED